MKEIEPQNTKQLRILALPYRTIEKTNPYQSLLYEGMVQSGAQIDQFTARRLVTGRWSIWHIHWPESLVATVPPKPLPQTIIQILKTWILLKTAQLKGTKIVWTAHNLKPHESIYPKLGSIWLNLFVKNLDAVICLSESGKQQLFLNYPSVEKLPIYVIPHGHYRSWYPDAILKDEARAQLRIASGHHMVLFFGLIRPYKNVPKLIECFVDASIPDWNLFVAGRVKQSALIEHLSKARGKCKRVSLILDFVKKEEVQTYFRAADLFVVPFNDILNSGSAILSLSFDCPVLVPNKGAMGDLQRMAGSDWVMTYDGDLNVKVLRKAFAWVRNVHRAKRAPLDSLDWNRISDRTSAAFREIACHR